MKNHNINGQKVEQLAKQLLSDIRQATIEYLSDLLNQRELTADEAELVYEIVRLGMQEQPNAQHFSQQSQNISHKIRRLLSR